MQIRFSNFFFIGFAGLGLIGFFACAGAEGDKATPVNGIFYTAQKSLSIRVYAPDILAFDRETPDSFTLIPVSRVLALNEYDALVEPELTQDKQRAVSVVTGIGIEAVDFTSEAKPIPIHLGVVAREFDTKTGVFGSEIRIFSAPGESLDSTQDFSIQNDNSGTFVFTGVGMRLREGRISKLVLQRKHMGKLGFDGDPVNASTKVILPAGWAAIGFKIKFSKTQGTQDKTPFIQDAIFYKGALTIEEN